MSSSERFAGTSSVEIMLLLLSKQWRLSKLPCQAKLGLSLYNEKIRMEWILGRQAAVFVTELMPYYVLLMLSMALMY